MAKILIVVPNMGWICTPLSLNFVYWLKNYDTELIAPVGFKPISYARNYCVDRFLQTEADHMWLIDADTAPPAHALIELLEAKAPVIAASVNQIKRDVNGELKPARLLMSRGEDGQIYSVEGNGVQKIDRAGFACVLFSRWVLEKIGCPWFEERPWGKVRGTDFVFCEKMEQLGIPLYGHFDIQCPQFVETFV